VAVTDDFFGKSKPLIQMIKIEFGDLGASDCCRAWKEYCTYRTSVIYNCEDGVITFAVR